VVIPAGQMRVLLASLLVSVGRSVPVATLAEQLWPERMPVRARATVHTYVARLRRLLGHGGIETTPEGYFLAVAPEQVDLWRFRDLLSRATLADSADAELGLIREALGLWRGRPFAGIESTWLDREVVPRLGEERLAVTERRIDLELPRSDHPGNVVMELRDLVRTCPTRESLWLRLIDALHRAGRRAEALEAYQQVREVLTNELGIEPGDALQQLQRRVLMDGATGSDHAAVPPGPDGGAIRQLPPDVAHFVDRDESARLNRLLTTFEQDGRALTRVVAIDGAPGIGKSALALHWAHQVAPGYPDLQLHLDLHGYGPAAPVPPSVAVGVLLRGLGVPRRAVPVTLDERAALLRSTLAGRRVLLLLDNARSAGQVRPLLPGTDSLVIVTSRHRLRGLSVRDGAHRVTLDRLAPDEAVSLLAAVLGRGRVAAERAAAARLVELCDGLPLGLAIVAERARGVGGLTEVMRAALDERARLDVFGDGDGDPPTDLWVALSWSYRALPADAAAMFRSLGLHPAADIALEAAAALAGMPVRRAKRSLDHLVAAHLVEQRRAHRYELHNLIRWYAAARATQHGTANGRTATVGRLPDRYPHGAVNADVRPLPRRSRDLLAPYRSQDAVPELPGAAPATTWFEHERSH
jgi:DNA-binding SARP family transcriptional activator